MLRWTEDGVECDASDKGREALLEGLNSSEASKTLNSAAVKAEDIGHTEDANMLDEVERGSSSRAWRATRREGSQISERSGKSGRCGQGHTTK